MNDRRPISGFRSDAQLGTRAAEEQMNDPRSISGFRS
jgi:hypothetical protein